MSEELFTLSSDDFESNCRDAFLGWWKDKEFADVTLATEDDHQISVHGVVLSSASQLFKSLLSKNPHPHPLIYLTGVSMNNLQSVLEYIYRDQCDVQQEDLEGFLKIGQELLISGLTQDFDTKIGPGADDLVKKADREKIMSTTKTTTKSIFLCLGLVKKVYFPAPNVSTQQDTSTI